MNKYLIDKKQISELKARAEQHAYKEGNDKIEVSSLLQSYCFSVFMFREWLEKNESKDSPYLRVLLGLYQEDRFHICISDLNDLDPEHRANACSMIRYGCDLGVRPEEVMIDGDDFFTKLLMKHN